LPDVAEQLRRPVPILGVYRRSLVKLFNAIATFDVYVVAESPEAARAALVEALRDPAFNPSEQVGYEVTRENSIRAAWRDEKPFVGADVSDADFEKVKGKTTVETFNMLHTKAPPTKPAK
jgi:hypothetical protein